MAKQTTSEPDLPRSSFSGLPSIFAKGELDSQDQTMSGSAASKETPTKPTTMAAVLTGSTATPTGACFGHTNNNVLNRNYNSSVGNGNSRIYSNIMSTTFSEAAKIRSGAGAAAAAAANVVEAIDDDDDVDIDADDLGVYVEGLDEMMNPAGSADGRLSAATTGTRRRRRDSPREILYTKFGEFLVARLNSLQEISANELMNQILVLIAEK